MAKRKHGNRTLRSSGKNVAKSDGNFEIPTLLKTEQIEVESNIKPEIFTPCTDSKSLKTTGLVDKTIFYTCCGCVTALRLTLLLSAGICFAGTPLLREYRL